MSKNVISIAKFESNTINEDSAICRNNIVAVSDGAGGGGVFAEKWSMYLLENLPDKPIVNTEELDTWIDEIWEQFYNEYEKKAAAIGGLFLSKFYDEGSFATLAAAWKISENDVKWLSYGDSVVFHYNKFTDKLEYSISNLSEFNQAPYLINYTDKINPKGVKTGSFTIDEHSYVFVASDALAHYILMMYAICHKPLYNDHLTKALVCRTKNSNFIQAALAKSETDFFTKVIKRLLLNQHNFTLHLKKLYKNGLIALDDYSVAIIH